LPFANTTTFAWDANWNEVAGVYMILDAQRRVIYVGETDNLKRRMDEHRTNTNHPMHSYKPTHVMFEAISNEVARKQREQVLIGEFSPLTNG